MQDHFGNEIDPEVRYARGQILASSVDEMQRYTHAQEVVRLRVSRAGEASIGIFTGNQRAFPLLPDDLGPPTEEWVGPALVWPQLREAVLQHLGGHATDEVAVFNRTSAGLVAAVSALGSGGTVVSLAHPASGAHVSVARGARLGGCKFVETGNSGSLSETMSQPDVRLLVITPVSSELDTLALADIQTGVSVARQRNVPVLLDDAYGARLRPVLEGGPRSLELGVDVAISNTDKAGLEGPRAGFMAGRADLVKRAESRAAELGQEARAPILLAVLRSLQRYTPQLLLEEIDVGHRLGVALDQRLGQTRVRQTAIGPLVGEDDILTIALERAGIQTEDVQVVPSEASSGFGMLLLEHEGILTVNALGRPGSRVSLRLKPTSDAVDRLGGIDEVVNAVDRSLDRLAGVIGDPKRLRALILG